MSAQITTLSNGMTVASLTMAGAHSVNVGLWVKAGGRDELAGEHGIAHMLEHMAFKGTGRRSAQDIATQVEAVGGYMNAHTAREETAYYIRLLPEHLALAVDVLFDIVNHSSLPEEEIERERGVILQEIGQSLDTPDDVVFENFSAASYHGHKLGESILGTTQSVSSFTRDDLNRFMQRYYGGEQMLLCAAGAVDHEALVAEAEKHADGVRQATSPIRQAPTWSGGRIIQTRDLEQAHVIAGLQAPTANDGDRYALMLLSTLYGGGMASRLFQQVREQRGLCYSIFSFAQTLSDSGVFGIYAGTAAKDVDEMLSVSCDALKSMAQDLGQDEVERGKSQMRAAILMGQESVSGMTESMARQLLLFGEVRAPKYVAELVEKLTKDDVIRMIHRLTDDAKPALSLIGPSDQVMSNDELRQRLVA
ncbi:MAG: M16 family metallopeptidase [Candidatus Puniceispirillaceae bacterium]